MDELILYSDGRDTLISVTEEGIMEGLIDKGVVISGLREMKNIIRIPVTGDSASYRTHSLCRLVMSSADSFTFCRVGDTITNATEDIGDTPWRVDVGDLILRYFEQELRCYIPLGVWHLHARSTSED